MYPCAYDWNYWHTIAVASSIGENNNPQPRLQYIQMYVVLYDNMMQCDDYVK